MKTYKYSTPDGSSGIMESTGKVDDETLQFIVEAKGIGYAEAKGLLREIDKIVRGNVIRHEEKPGLFYVLSVLPIDGKLLVIDEGMPKSFLLKVQSW